MWTSVVDGLPEVDVSVLVCNSKGYISIANLTHSLDADLNEVLEFWGGYTKVEDVTFWMPLPDPPEGVHAA
jgi:hypothetical protein